MENFKNCHKNKEKIGYLLSNKSRVFNDKYNKFATNMLRNSVNKLTYKSRLLDENWSKSLPPKRSTIIIKTKISNPVFK